VPRHVVSVPAKLHAGAFARASVTTRPDSLGDGLGFEPEGYETAPVQLGFQRLLQGGVPMKLMNSPAAIPTSKAKSPSAIRSAGGLRRRSGSWLNGLCSALAGFDDLRAEQHWIHHGLRVELAPSVARCGG